MLWPRALGLVALIVLNPVCASSEQRIEIRLILSERVKAAVKKDQIDLFMPRFTECKSCTEVTFSPPGGGRYTVEAEPEPRVVLTDSDIEEVKLAEIRSALDPSVRTWNALAMPTNQARARLAQISNMFPFDSVLVTLSGKPVDVHNIATWSSGIRLGVFRERDELAKFAETLSGRRVWVEFDEKGFDKSRRELESVLRKVPAPDPR